MRTSRSPEMTLVAYFMFKFREFDPVSGHYRPPAEIGVTTWSEAFHQFFDVLGGGREFVTFCGSMHGEINGFVDRLKKGRDLTSIREQIVNPWKDRTRAVFWEEVSRYLRESSDGRLPDSRGASDAEAFAPSDEDHREVVERAIRIRRGQEKFRAQLLTKYGSRCLVTGSKVVAILEAAHINPYRSQHDHHEANGLLLRADIHTLFDLDLLGIHPETLEIELADRIKAEYACLVHKRLLIEDHRRPSTDALRLRYDRFKQCRDLAAEPA